MAIHGVNPRTGEDAAVIGDNCFVKAVDQKVTQTTKTPDEDIEDAIALVQGSEENVTGLIMSPTFKSALAAMKDLDHRKLYPELAWGSTPGTINGLAVQSNSTVGFNQSRLKAVVGDFTNCFKWGFAKEIPLEVIEYGNPDNDETLGDLKGHNQVYLRSEAYLGWGILVPEAFALINGAA